MRLSFAGEGARGGPKHNYAPDDMFSCTRRVLNEKGLPSMPAPVVISNTSDVLSRVTRGRLGSVRQRNNAETLNTNSAEPHQASNYFHH